jgi:hypothetical protein
MEDDAVAGKSFKANVLVIDDWEKGQNWTTEDAGVALSLSDDHYEGKKSMRINVSDSVTKKIYESKLWNDSNYPPSMWLVDAWLADGTHYKAYPMGNTNVNDPSISAYINPSIAMIRIKYHNNGFFGAYSGNLRCEIRDMFGGTCSPGNIIGTSEILPVSTYGINQPATFIFSGLQTTGAFQFIVTADPLPDASKMFRLKMQTNVEYQQGKYVWIPSNPRTLYEDGNGWNCYTVVSLVCQIYSGKPITYRTFSQPIDCDGKTKFRVAIKSALSGNVIDLIFGTDNANTHRVKLNIGSTSDWQVLEIPIPKGENKFGYFAFMLGEGALDEATGGSKPNIIYIDDFVAE